MTIVNYRDCDDSIIKSDLVTFDIPEHIKNKYYFTLQLNSRIVKFIANDKTRNKNALIKIKQCLELLQIDFSKIHISENLVFYGYGETSKVIFDKLRDKCNVRCFVDKIKTGYHENIPILSVNEYKALENEVILVFPTHDFNRIKYSLKANMLPDTKIIEVEKFLKEKSFC